MGKIYESHTKNFNRQEYVYEGKLSTKANAKKYAKQHKNFLHRIVKDKHGDYLVYFRGKTPKEHKFLKSVRKPKRRKI